MRADRRNPVIKELRKFKPAKFLIELRDGTRKEAPLSAKANKWEIFDELIGRLPWVSIEAQDNDGKTLGIVESDAVDEDEGTDEANGADIYERMAKISGDLCLRIMQSTQKETRLMFADAIHGNGEAIANILESQRAMQDSYQVAIKMATLSATKGEGGAEGADPVMDMMKMAMMIQAGKPPQPPPPMMKKPPVVNGTSKPVDKG